MRIRTSFRGPFLGCSAYPKCKGTQKLTDEMKEKFKDLLPQRAPKKELPKVEITEVCPNCGGEMVLRSGRGGTYFLGCKKYPKCKGTREATPAILEQVAPS
jgi:DNA topoisomerase-1